MKNLRLIGVFLHSKSSVVPIGSIFFLIFNVVLCCRRAAHAQIGRDDRRSQKTENPNLFRVEICKERSPSASATTTIVFILAKARVDAHGRKHTITKAVHIDIYYTFAHTRALCCYNTVLNVLKNTQQPLVFVFEGETVKRSQSTK